MNKYSYILILILGCFFSVFAQVLLKKAAQNEYSSFLGRFFNVLVISGYLIFFIVMIVNIWVLKFIPMSVFTPVTESLPLILSFFVGRIIFKEVFSYGIFIGTTCIIVGIFIIVFNI